jgi:hypothetical protein
VRERARSGRVGAMARLLPAALALALSACTSDPAPPDAGADAGADAGPAPDTGPRAAIVWSEAPPLPVELAHAYGVILASDAARWLFVVGGASWSSGAAVETSPRAYRAEIGEGGALGAWQDAGLVGGAMGIPISQHGILRLTGEDLRQGMAIAGGLTGTGGEVPVVLATYVDGAGALDRPYGRFPPMIAAGDGQWQSAFMPFDPHALALVGGLTDAGFTARVQIAQIYLGVDVPTFVDGPPLPAPRAAHGWVRRDRPGLNPDLYVVGGHNADGSTDEVLHATRDAMDQVDGWEVVGTLTSAPHGHASAVLGTQLYVIGGYVGGTLTDRVRRADFAADGTLGRFETLTDASLPRPLAHAAAVQDGATLYLVGGIEGDASTTRVLIGQL